MISFNFLEICPKNFGNYWMSGTNIFSSITNKFKDFVNNITCIYIHHQNWFPFFFKNWNSIQLDVTMNFSNFFTMIAAMQ